MESKDKDVPRDAAGDALPPSKEPVEILIAYLDYLGHDEWNEKSHLPKNPEKIMHLIREDAKHTPIPLDNLEYRTPYEILVYLAETNTNGVRPPTRQLNRNQDALFGGDGSVDGSDGEDKDETNTQSTGSSRSSEGSMQVWGNGGGRSLDDSDDDEDQESEDVFGLNDEDNNETSTSTLARISGMLHDKQFQGEAKAFQSSRLNPREAPDHKLSRTGGKGLSRLDRMAAQMAGVSTLDARQYEENLQKKKKASKKRLKKLENSIRDVTSSGNPTKAAAKILDVLSSEQNFWSNMVQRIMDEDNLSEAGTALEKLPSSEAELNGVLKAGMPVVIRYLKDTHPKTYGILGPDVLEYLIRSTMSLVNLNRRRRERLQKYMDRRKQLLDTNPFDYLLVTQQRNACDQDASFFVPPSTALTVLMELSDYILKQYAGRHLQAQQQQPTSSNQVEKSFPRVKLHIVWRISSIEAMFKVARQKYKHKYGCPLIAEATLLLVWAAFSSGAFEKFAPDMPASDSGIGILGGGRSSHDSKMVQLQSWVREWTDAVNAWNGDEDAATNMVHERLFGSIEHETRKALSSPQFLGSPAADLAKKLLSKTRLLRYLELEKPRKRPILFYNWVAMERSLSGKYPTPPKDLSTNYTTSEERTAAYELIDAYNVLTANRVSLGLLLQFIVNVAEEAAATRRVTQEAGSALNAVADMMLETIVEHQTEKAKRSRMRDQLIQDIGSACTEDLLCSWPSYVPVRQAYRGIANDLLEHIQRILQCRVLRSSLQDQSIFGGSTDSQDESLASSQYQDTASAVQTSPQTNRLSDSKNPISPDDILNLAHGREHLIQ